MEKVRLGRTNLRVTRLGWGGIPIQRVGEKEAVSVIRAVAEMGGEIFDTARSYTNSEHKIGLALKKIEKPVILSSKSHVKTGKIYDDVKESLKQMGVQKIQIYHLHNVLKSGDYENVMSPGGAYEGLKRARDEGLIDHIGLSSHNLNIIERGIEDGRFDVVMVCCSFLEPDAARRIFSSATAKDIGILVMKPFSGGVIEEAGPALRFVLSTPGTVVLAGSETVDKARQNWKVFLEGHTLTEEDRERIDALRKEFDRQFCRRCDYCQPCPEKIGIQFILGLKSLLKRFGPQAQELGWLKDLIKASRNCKECGECVTRCPYGLPIPELIKKNLDWFDRFKNRL
jgi:predicted aldo/keto reductase-like oxidoreductase